RSRRFADALIADFVARAGRGAGVIHTRKALGRVATAAVQHAATPVRDHSAGARRARRSRCAARAIGDAGSGRAAEAEQGFSMLDERLRAIATTAPLGSRSLLAIGLACTGNRLALSSQGERHDGE